MQNKRELGSFYENIACEYLLKNNFKIIDRNFRTKHGEIDLIGFDGTYLVFVEVKYKKNNKLGYAIEAVTKRKAEQIRKMAYIYLYIKKYSINTDIRFDIIQEKALAIGIGIIEPKRIDEINILQATYEAMRIALSKLSIRPNLLLNDAVTIPNVDIKQIPLIHGDTLSASIAAASIRAKGTRDRLMLEYDKEYPEYSFSKHKGYGTKLHDEAIKKFGLSKIHRLSFCGKYL